MIRLGLKPRVGGCPAVAAHLAHACISTCLLQPLWCNIPGVLSGDARFSDARTLKNAIFKSWLNVLKVLCMRGFEQVTHLPPGEYWLKLCQAYSCKPQSATIWGTCKKEHLPSAVLLIDYEESLFCPYRKHQQERSGPAMKSGGMCRSWQWPQARQSQPARS